ncbi:MAG: hypothetical protein OXG23_17650 [Chloroflexi bacterium]|nr:hypothetical protein [Chloroflexota bacterium]MCY3979929.1 hypothetical protein [Chloroflexota bacterium]MDE2636284.1 hypothetical protein [Chloroflexota bacterium]
MLDDFGDASAAAWAHQEQAIKLDKSDGDEKRKTPRMVRGAGGTE